MGEQENADRNADEKRRARRGPRWRGWAFALVPLVGLLELAAHAVQTCGHVDEGDWRAARAYVAARAKSDDLVAFAPRWVDPIGREFFGSGLATLEREARADESRFARAFEVSIRGAHLGVIAAWKRVAEQRFGTVTVTTLDNPAPSPVIVDLVSRFDAQHARVSQTRAGSGSSETPCGFVRGGVISGGLGFGPAVPAERFACPGGGVAGVSVVADRDYVPRRCVFAPPPGGTAARRIRFADVRLGRSLSGHHTIYVEAERDRSGAPVTLTFRIGDSVVGQAVHRDGEGWTPFEFDTTSLAGTDVELTVDVECPSGDRRLYCFEATTR